MVERIEETEARAPEPGPPGGEPSAAPITAALRRARTGGKADPEFDAFLRKQSRLIDLQTEHLHEQREVQLSHLKLSRFNELMQAALRVMTFVVGLAVVAVVAGMAWQAHLDRGVTIEAFSVPPDLAARGLTGQVVANRLLDRLSELQARTVTGRPASTYADDWGDDIKVEIPETGVSIGELNRWLRQWLGSQTRISGEVVRTPAGLSVTARMTGASGGQSFDGSDAALNRLIQQAAEAVYMRTQPYRWAAYLASTGKPDEAVAAYAWLAEHGSPQDRAWAYVGWASILLERGQNAQARDKALKALQFDPRINTAYIILNISNDVLGHDEEVLAGGRAELRMLEAGHVEDATPRAVRQGVAYLSRVVIPGRLSDYESAARESLPGHPDLEGIGAALPAGLDYVRDLVALHEVSAARRAPSAGGLAERAFIAIELEDWPTVLDLVKGAGPTSTRTFSPVARAIWAEVLARVGRRAEAQAMIATTPLDCAQCLATRGIISALAGDRTGTDRWFAEAARQTSSLPQWYEGWGRMLLRLGDADAAIDKARAAQERGPHWADPLELWGEALMAKRDYAGAVARFAEADKDAPRWGRNHMRWGEALMLSGRYAEARAQYQIANGLDLSRPDRAALNVLLARTAKGPLHGGAREV
jgi:tetratricopeptide (TPR) repeat protein